MELTPHVPLISLDILGSLVFLTATTSSHFFTSSEISFSLMLTSSGCPLLAHRIFTSNRENCLFSLIFFKITVTRKLCR